MLLSLVQVGDSAVVAVGSSEGILGTSPTYPEGNLIAGNHIHEFGIYGKQTSCYFQVECCYPLLPPRPSSFRIEVNPRSPGARPQNGFARQLMLQRPEGGHQLERRLRGRQHRSGTPLGSRATDHTPYCQLGIPPGLSMSHTQGNLIFNQVRETGDHGPYNSWDRQPYLTLSGVPDGYDPKLK